MEKDIPLTMEMLSTLDNDKYLISSAKEIEFILRHIAQSGTRVALYYDNASNFILTTVLDADNAALWLEQSPDDDENSRILDSGKLVFVSSHLQVKVQFYASRASRGEHQGYRAFRLRLPAQIYRLQRREYFRLPIPPSTSLRCTIATAKPHARELREVVILDISCGGVGLACLETDAELVPGESFPDCQIELPEIGTITGTIEVKNIFLLTLPSGNVQKHVGCAFKKLDTHSNILLQRYITNMQRAKKIPD